MKSSMKKIMADNIIQIGSNVSRDKLCSRLPSPTIRRAQTTMPDSPNPDPPIFLDSTSNPIKFFIQQNLSEEVKASLTQTIVSLGGKVLEKVPNRGYILTDPHTEEEERLRRCWIAFKDRPERFLVPFTWVEACRVRGAIIPMLFAGSEDMMKIWIHPDISNVNVRKALSARIRVCSLATSGVVMASLTDS